MQSTKYTQQSQEMKIKLDDLIASWTDTQQEDIVNTLKIAPLLLACKALQDELKDKSRLPSEKSILRAEGLIQKYNELYQPMTQNDVTQVLFTSNESAKQHTQFHKTELGEQDLASMLYVAQACTRDEKAVIKAYHQDSKEGGSVHFLANQAYVRLYFAMERSERPVAILDCIEPQNMGISSVAGYVNTKKETMFLGTLTSSIKIAKQLGLPFLLAGEDEVTELCGKLGFNEREIFTSTEAAKDEKLGIGGATRTFEGEGTYMWRMGSSTKFRAIPIEMFQEEYIDDLAKSAEDTLKRLRKNHPELLNRAAQLYISALSAILEFTNKDKSTALNELCAKYDFTPSQLPQPACSIRRIGSTDITIKNNTIIGDNVYSGLDLNRYLQEYTNMYQPQHKMFPSKMYDLEEHPNNEINIYFRKLRFDIPSNQNSDPYNSLINIIPRQPIIQKIDYSINKKYITQKINL